MTPLLVAELSANHLGNFDRAIALVEAAAKAGANAVKTQCFTPEQMADPETVIESGPWAGRKLYELYCETYTPRDWHAKLFSCAKELGMIGFASVFHPDDVDFLETLDCPMYKISSFEILDLQLIRHAAKTGKPVVISTGMATLDEIWLAFDACNQGRPGPKPWECPWPTLLRCTSAYPASAEDAALVSIPDLAHRYDCNVGLSDHTLGLGVAVAAVTLGATMIEKHLTLSRADGGPDAAFSSEPHEFAAMVVACREAAAALGEVRYGPTESEMSSLPLRRKPGGKRGG